MMSTPKTEDHGEDANRNIGKDFERAANTAVHELKTSIFAVLGAGDIVGQAINSVVAKATAQSEERREDAPGPYEERTRDEKTDDASGLRGRVDPAELRTLFDESTDAATRLYRRLADSGNLTWERLTTQQPQVRRGVEHLGSTLQTAQQRVDDVASDVRSRVDEVRTRIVGDDASGQT